MSETVDPACIGPEDFVLKVENLGKRFSSDPGERWGVRGVSFLLPPGGSLAVVGPNGGGKSTLMRILAGVIRPTEGRVTGRGRVVSLQALHLGIAPELTIRDAAIAQGAFWGVPRQEVLAGLEEALDWCEIAMGPGERISRLSDGMMDRLAFAANMMLKPRLLLADGNLGLGDEVFYERCLERIERLIEDGTALVLATHRRRLVERFCRDVLVLEDGLVVGRGAWPPMAKLGMAAGAGLAEEDNESFLEGDDMEDGGVLGDECPRPRYPKQGVVALEPAGALADGKSVFDTADRAEFDFSADVQPDRAVRFKADFFRGSEPAFRFVSPEFLPAGGRMHFRLTLPPGLLPGKWRCEVAPAGFDGKRAIGRFDVVMERPELTALGDWRGRMPGVMAPVAEWSLERLADLPADDLPSPASNPNGAIHRLHISSTALDGLASSAALSIDIDFSLAADGLPARCSLDFLFEGARAFRILMPHPRPLAAGVWRARACLAPNTLAEGTYSINAILVFPVPEGPTPLLLYDAGSVRVKSDVGAGARAGWRGGMPGVLMPRADWTCRDAEV